MEDTKIKIILKILLEIIVVLLIVFMLSFFIIKNNRFIIDYDWDSNCCEELSFITEIIEEDTDQYLTIETEEDKTLNELANSKLNDLLSTGYWSHTNSNGCDFNCRTMDYTENGKYSWIGENLYKGPCDIENVYRLWEKSASHKAVLDHSFDESVLISEKYGENQCYYILERGILK